MIPVPSHRDPRRPRVTVTKAAPYEGAPADTWEVRCYTPTATALAALQSGLTWQSAIATADRWARLAGGLR